MSNLDLKVLLSSTTFLDIATIPRHSHKIKHGNLKRMSRQYLTLVLVSTEIPNFKHCLSYKKIIIEKRNGKRYRKSGT